MERADSQTYSSGYLNDWRILNGGLGDHGVVQTAAATRNLSTSRICLEGGKRFDYLDNLPFNTHVMQLKTAAEPFGVLKKINLPMNARGKPAGFANIEFAEERDAVTFVESIEEYGLSTISQQYVENSSDTVFLNKLPKNVRHLDLEDALGLYGEILRIAFAPGSQAEEGPMAFVQFASEEIAATVVKDAQNSQISVKGERPWVNFARKKTSDQAARPKFNNPSDTIHVASLPLDITTHELKAIFGTYGEIQRVDLPENPRRTISFIKFSSTKSAEKAVEAGKKHEIKIRGETPYVDFSARHVKKTETRERTNGLYLSALPGTSDDVKELFKPYENNIRGMYFFKQADRIASVINFDSPEAAARALEEVKTNNKGDFTLEYAKSWPKNAQNKNSERRNSYGGDWGRGARNSHFYRQN
ncbi:hypothetical protein MPER_10046 [Moniliophthora perniciosa FA553]|nr:hypothetical protein MPER_10046 [Moniliophthora perniciosa FA553]